MFFPRAGGYILYPPDFDPKQKYPVFIEPYAYQGFSGSVGQESPLQVYAAAGMVVLSFGYPDAVNAPARFGRETSRKLYSKELGFPYLTMLMESTTRGLDTAAQRGFTDLTRVGIGSISMGTLVPQVFALVSGCSALRGGEPYSSAVRASTNARAATRAIAA